MADMQGQLPFVTDTVKHQTRVDDIDVYIHPDVSSIGILEFNKYNAIIKHGYDIGLRLAREWKAENPDAAALLEHGSNRRGLASGSRDRKFNLPSDTNLSELSQRRARHDTSPTGAPREARTSESGIFHEETRSSDAYQFSDDDVALRRTSSDTRTMLTTDAMWTPTANKQKRRINF